MVDLDENYAPKSLPTVFQKTELPDGVDEFEDPRLFVHRGALYLLAFGFGLKDRPRWQYLVRLERLPAAANVTAGTDPTSPASFRLVQPRRLLLPEELPSGLPLAADFDRLFRKPHAEKNWMPFVYNDSIHFFYSINPLVVLRVLADPLGANSSADIRTEFVSLGGGAHVRWRYGAMRGGTPALYDAALGGYVAFFHSQVNFESDVKSPTGDAHRKYYYMGLCIFAAQPPFSIQLISTAPLVGVGFYNESKAYTEPQRIIFPVGLIVNDSIGTFIISYGKDDKAMRVAHFDRSKLLATLHPPLPEGWEGPPC